MAKNRKTVRASSTGRCPCSSGERYADCCEPLHMGTRQASDAVELMRSRYSGFATGNHGYLWSTLHEDHDDYGQGRESYLQQLASNQGNHRYMGLRILDSRSEDAQGVSQVLFQATVKQHKLDRSFIELSDFVRDDRGLRYINGTAKMMRELSHPPDDMTIDHWQCDHQHAHH